MPGTLVKGSAPEVFLVDGTHTLVPIATFDVARDVGIPTTFQTVADSILEPFDIAQFPLSNKIRCHESVYLASGGRLHPAYEAQLPNVRSTELAVSTCYKLTISTVPFNSFLSGKGMTWLVTQLATKRAILGSPLPASFPVNSWFLDQIYTGAPRVVGLVKFSDQPAVYLANGYERLIRIPSFESVSDLGMPTGFVTRPGTERAEYAIDDGVLGNSVRCGSTVYVGSGGALWPITDRLAEGLPVTEVLGSVCARMPQRSASISTALLMKSPTTSMVYNVFAGTKEPVTSMEEATRLSSPEPVNFLTVRGSYLDLLPTVAERLTPERWSRPPVPRPCTSSTVRRAWCPSRASNRSRPSACRPPTASSRIRPSPPGRSRRTRWVRSSTATATSASHRTGRPAHSRCHGRCPAGDPARGTHLFGDASRRAAR